MRVWSFSSYLIFLNLFNLYIYLKNQIGGVLCALKKLIFQVFPSAFLIPSTDLPGPSTALNVVDELCDSIDDRLQKQRREKDKPSRKNKNTTTFASKYTNAYISVWKILGYRLIPACFKLQRYICISWVTSGGRQNRLEEIEKEIQT